MKTDSQSKTNWTDRQKANSKRLALFTFIWVASNALLAFGPKFFWHFNFALSISAVVVNLIAGAGMLYAHKRYLVDLDELQKRINLEAMALCLGVGLVIGLCYESLEDIQLISFEPQIAHLTFIMCFAYMAGLIRGHRKYK